jgi:hypothetical protein
LFKLLKAFIKIGIFLLIILFVAAYFTNPDDSMHRKKLHETVKDLRLKKVRDKNVQVDDYYVFSLAKVNESGEQRVVGIGVFGKVWYFDDISSKK